MTAHRAVLEMHVAERRAAVDLTGRVEAVVRASRVREGLALVFPRHTSAAVVVSDADEGIAEDLLDLLARVAPPGAGYRHDEVDGKRNADGHLAAALAGHHVCLPVTRGRLDLGRWGRVWYLELDGGREKDVAVHVVGE